MPRFLLFSCLIILLMALVAGCSGKEDYNPELGNVSGTVTLDGKPLASAVITFVPQVDSSVKLAPPSGAVTDATGKYTLKFKGGKDGAIPGTHAVRISTDLDGTSDPAKEKVPQKYNSRSTLTETVKLGDNTINFDLKSK